MDSRGLRPHAVLVSGPGLGLVNGCLLLAKAFRSVDVYVTFVCFARTHSTHASNGRLKLSDPSIRLEIVPDGLPSEIESYTDLFVTTPAMHQGLLQLLYRLSAEGHPATCLVSDTLVPWTQDVADQIGIPRVEYWTGSATSYLSAVLALPGLLSQGLVCSHKGPRPLGWKSKNPVFVDCVPGMPGYPLDEVAVDFRYAESEQHPIFSSMLEAAGRAKDADCLLIHSAAELEKEAFTALKLVAGIQAYPIGPLIHQYSNANSTTDPTLTWLDSKSDSSVVYVAFGSNAVLSEHEIAELALGLENSGQAFLWVIRADGIEKGLELDDVLPPGFKPRSAEQGLIVPWVSQLAVLEHPAIGGFLSHCGWNSTLETLWAGVPVLAHPRRAEQPLNCRFLVKEWGVGIELETLEEGIFLKEHVEKGIRALLQEEHGRIARIKAKELSRVVKKAPFQGGQSYSNLLEFASRMKRRCIDPSF